MLTNLEKVYLLQKKALRLIYDLPRDHPPAQPSQAAAIPKVFSLHKLRLVLRYKYEIKNNILMLNEIAELAESFPVYTFRLTEKFRVKSSRMNYGAQMLRITLCFKLFRTKWC